MIRWIVGGLAVGVGIGWAAAKVHATELAPAGLLSIGVGIVLGFLLTWLVRISGVSSRKHLLVGAAAFAVVAVLSEHAWLYRDFRRQWIEVRAADPHVAMFRPETPWSPAEYFRHEMSIGRAIVWFVDAMLVIGGAVGIIWFRSRSQAIKSSPTTQTIP